MNDRQRTHTSRRQFLRSTASGLLVTGAIASTPARASEHETTATANDLSPGEVLRTAGHVASDGRHLREEPRGTPIVGASEVLVCGGGPAGIGAALAAARAGASVQLIEAAGCLGGVWTAGLLTKVLDAENKSGIMAELLALFAKQGSHVARQTRGTVYDPEVAKLVLEQLCVDAGVKIRLHTRLVGAVTDRNHRLVAIVTESKSGREAWLAERFVDCTGDGDLAAHAGCRFDVGIGPDCRCQPMSMIALVTGVDADAIGPFIRETDAAAKRRLLELLESAGFSPSYRAPTLRHLHSGIYSLMTNHEYGVSAFDAEAITEATIRARREVHDVVAALRKIGGAWKDLAVVATAEQIGIREGRRIRGRDTITADHLASGLRHEQAVCTVRFPVDVHALDAAGSKQIDQSFKPETKRPYDIPFPALVAADVDNLLMAGRCISGDFVAHSSYRVTGNAVPMGEAAGLAAAVSVRQGRLPHELDWQAVRRSS